jgi:hypothetical protein
MNSLILDFQESVSKCELAITSLEVSYNNCGRGNSRTLQDRAVQVGELVRLSTWLSEFAEKESYKFCRDVAR